MTACATLLYRNQSPTLRLTSGILSLTQKET